MAYTPASRTAGGLSITQLVGGRREPLVQRSSALLRECPVQLLASLGECPVQCLSVSLLVARRPKYCAAKVPIRVRTLTPAAIMAATTAGSIAEMGCVKDLGQFLELITQRLLRCGAR